MAGSILISDQVGIALSTRDFDYLVERIRVEFPLNDRRWASEIFEPMDEGGMTFISLIDCSGDGFCSFFNAVLLAKKKAEDVEGYLFHAAQWEELLSSLRSDPRYAEGCKE